jgi:uncharacterized protein
MPGLKDLQSLLARMEPQIQEGEFVFCSLRAGEVSPFDDALLQFREREGMTVVVARERAERLKVEYSCPFRLITLAVHSDLEAVGFLAAITTALAEAGISVNVVSAYFHDHLLVPVDNCGKALDVLRDLSAVERRRCDVCRD